MDVGLLPGGTFTFAVDVNDAGQVVGNGDRAGSPMQAFVWTASGGVVEIGTLGGNVARAEAINNSGQVVGVSTTASGAAHAFSWTQSGGMVDIGPLPGNISSSAIGVSDAGVVAANSDGGSALPQGFVWSAAGGVTGVGSAGNSSVVTGINAAGQVVGREGTPVGFRSFVWT